MTIKQDATQLVWREYQTWILDAMCWIVAKCASVVMIFVNEIHQNTLSYSQYRTRGLEECYTMAKPVK